MERPVPPPMATTRMGWADAEIDDGGERKRKFAVFRVRSDSKQALRNLRIQQFGKARVVHHALKVVIRARLKAVFLDSTRWLSKVVEALLGLTGDGVEQGKAVVGVVGLWMAGKDALNSRAPLRSSRCSVAETRSRSFLRGWQR